MYKMKITGIVSFLMLSVLCNANNKGFENFITTSGYKLMDGKNEFRFLSFNVPNLNYVEDELSFTTVYPYRLPDEFEIRDAITSVKEMGGQVVRIYTLAVKNPEYPDTISFYVNSPGNFNEEAFKITDLMLSIANEMGIRIIFPLLNNWQWMGGRPQYAAFRGKEADAFWTDPQLIADFKKTIYYALNRTNTITGVKYKNDKAILCWETGNELVCPQSWTSEITRYIKSIDKNHLIMDGYYAIDERPVRTESVLEPSIDILSSHHYEENPSELRENIEKNVAIINGRKPYIIGEFGFESTSALDQSLDKIIANNQISGALVWSLRYHRSEGGFYYHTEPMGMGIYKAYHWPGFSSGNGYDEINFLNMFRNKAFLIQHKEPAEIAVPKSPILLNIANVYDINWKGSSGASGYNIERSGSPDGPWIQVGFNISDAEHPYFPLFHDNTAQIGSTYYYRVLATNCAGTSLPSNIAGPVLVQKQAIIDNMENFGSLFDSKNVSITSGDDRSFKEAPVRMSGKQGSEIIYNVPGNIVGIKVYSFEDTIQPSLSIYVSSDGKNYSKPKIHINEYSQGSENYNYRIPVLYSFDNLIEKESFLKIIFENKAQIARVEVYYK